VLYCEWKWLSCCSKMPLLNYMHWTVAGYAVVHMQNNYWYLYESGSCAVEILVKCEESASYMATINIRGIYSKRMQGNICDLKGDGMTGFEFRLQRSVRLQLCTWWWLYTVSKFGFILPGYEGLRKITGLIILLKRKCVFVWNRFWSTAVRLMWNPLPLVRKMYIL